MTCKVNCKVSNGRNLSAYNPLMFELRVQSTNKDILEDEVVHKESLKFQDEKHNFASFLSF